MPWKGYINSYKGNEAGVLLVDSAGGDDDVGEDMWVFPKVIPLNWVSRNTIGSYH